jgi:hypothetical protein
LFLSNQFFFSGVNSYVCGCALGFTGTLCQTRTCFQSNATLSQARYVLGTTSVADQIGIVAGGFSGSTYSNRVDLFNANSGVWTTVSLSVGRDYPVCTSLGLVALCAGGQTASGRSSMVDLFNFTFGGTPAMSTAFLSVARDSFMACSAKDVSLFAGGFDGSYRATVRRSLAFQC